MIRGGDFFRLLLFATVTAAVPFQRLGREVRSAPANNTQLSEECVSDDVVYHSGDQVPSPGPCEQCFCDPPNVICTMVKCKLNSGCKTIQRPNHCCPDYKCDCEYNGKIYNNGERLDRPDDPCQVCYCKGGEVMCTSITCYEREDCKPHFVDGQCCPKYDHCPIESVRFSGNSIRSVNSTSSKREMQPWLLTKEVSVQPSQVSSTETSTKVTEVRTEATSIKRYPQTIKIREILPTASLIREFASPKLSTYQKTVVSGAPILKFPATTVSHTTEHIREEALTTPELKLSTPGKENALPVTLEETLSSDGTTESVLDSKSKVENLLSSIGVDEGKESHEKTETEIKIKDDSEPDLDQESEHDTSQSHNVYRTRLPPSEGFVETLTDGKMNSEGQLRSDGEGEHVTGEKINSDETETSKGSSSDSSEQSSEISSKYTSDRSSSGQSDESSTETSTMSHPSSDVVVDLHNSPGKTKFTLPTVESFSTMNPNRYASDSDTTESSFPGSSSTELLTGGVYEDTSSEMSLYSGETESASETVITEQSEQNSNMVSEPVPTETITDDTDGENNSTSTESYRTSSYQTDSTPVGSSSEELFSTRATLTSQSEESNSPTESGGKKPSTFTHSSESSSSSSSDSSSSEENDGSDESNLRRDELPPILQLNEQIQYLKLGGHHEDSDNSGEQIQPLIHVDIFNIHSKAAPCNSTSINGNDLAEKNYKNDNPALKITEDIKTSTGDVQVSHIILSPNDLKVLAEMLINKQEKHSDKTMTQIIKNDVNNEESLVSTSPKTIEDELVTDTPTHFVVTSELDEFNSSSDNSTEKNSSESDESVLDSNEDSKMNHSALQVQQPESNESSEELLTTTSNIEDDVEVVTQLNKDEANINNSNSSEVNSSEEFPSDSSEAYPSSGDGMTEGGIKNNQMNDEVDTFDSNSTEYSNSKDVLSNSSKPEKYRNKKSKEMRPNEEVDPRDAAGTNSVADETYETTTHDERESSEEMTTMENTDATTPNDMDRSSESYTLREINLPDSEYAAQQTPSAIEEQRFSISKNFLKKNISPP